jgi:hypothetical protein
MPPAKRTTTRAVQRRSTPAEVAAAEADRVEAEAEALDSDWLIVPLISDELAALDVRVVPFVKWPRSVYRDFRNNGDFEALGRVVHPDDREAWGGYDCTITDIGSWVERCVAAAGQDVGESRASRRSAQRTARR